MIVVIQCASGKQDYAGHLRTLDGREVMFVANPHDVPRDGNQVYARPDDVSDTGRPWRSVLMAYNADPGDNSLNLLPAWRLYKNRIYEILASHCGIERLYILSAGWGLVRAGFLTPNYDITFQSQAQKFKIRKLHDRYADFFMMPPRTEEPVTFLGGKAYVSLFCELTSSAKGPRYVWYNSKEKPDAPGCIARRFHTAKRTNWHYDCAQAFVDGKLDFGGD